VSVRINGESSSNPAWKDWTPIVATDFVASANLVIGDARYSQVGKTVRFKLSISLTWDSSGITVGTNPLRFSLPVKAKLDTFGSVSPIGQVTMNLSTSVAPDGYTSLSRSNIFTGIAVLNTTNGYTAGGISSTLSTATVQILRTTTYNSVTYSTRSNFTSLLMPNSNSNIAIGDTWVITGTYEAA